MRKKRSYKIGEKNPKKMKSQPPTGLFFSPLGGQETLFYLRVASGLMQQL